MGARTLEIEGEEPPTSTRGPKREIGLALSGGGLRAAFFHVGVLAHLADRGLLKRVEVISTVSGGSIVGALYHLHVKDLMETSTDQEISDEDYVKIVRAVYDRLLAQGQRSFRWSMFHSLRWNLRMHRDDYSRSDRIGQLYEERLYRGIVGDGPVYTTDLRIHPIDGVPNARRENLVPEIVINATSLNTGHDWRFDGERMGEAAVPALYEGIDQNGIFASERYVAFREKKHRELPLGIAVAASAAVPVIFPPLSVTQAYEEQVQLVDGGVHDNQGVQAFVEGDFHMCIVSDASGQMRDARKPPTRLLGVGARVKSVIEDRLREEQLFRVRRKFGADAIIFHLRAGLPPKRTKAILAKEPDPVAVPVGAGRPRRFVVDPRVQHYLSKVRTDLDTFTQTEAAALACNGYALVANELDASGRTPEPEEASARWPFMETRELLARPTSRFLDMLGIASRKFAKPFLLDRPLRVTTALVAVLLAVAAGGLLLRGSAWSILLGGLAAFLVLLVGRRARPDESELGPNLGEVIVRLLTPVRFVGNVAGVIGLWLFSHAWRPFDRRYARAGRLATLLDAPGKVEAAIPEEDVPALARR